MMQNCLQACAALLGESGREIFPKQSEILVDRGDTGNFLNLPYFAGDNGMRYAINDEGAAATLEEFYELYITNLFRTASLRSIRPKRRTTLHPMAHPACRRFAHKAFPKAHGTTASLTSAST
jgi:hypothetical protein